MLATAYSFLPKALRQRVLGVRCLPGILILVLWAGSGALAKAATNELTGPAQFKAYAETRLMAARRRLHESPTNSQVLIEFAQAAFDRGEFADNDSERAASAEECIAVCRPWVAREPNSAPAHYYLGMHLGHLAQTKYVGAFRIVDEMEVEFKAAVKLDAGFDYAGPERNLGLLYLEAPVWASVGDKKKAKQHLLRAIELAPDFPENRLNYAEACLKWLDRPGAMQAMQELSGIWAKAKTNLTGHLWDSSWADWERRRNEVNRKIEADQKMGSPRHKS